MSILVNKRKYLAYLVFAAGLLVLYLVQDMIPTSMGRADFRAYWSTSRLLAQRNSCSDDATLLSIQSQHTGWNHNTNMRIWNPPWVIAWFLPLAYLDFLTATRLWLLTNIFFLFLAIILGYRLYKSKDGRAYDLGLIFLMAILFPSTIVAILMGQTSLLVLVGLVVFLWLYEQKKDFIAGVALALVTVKPHIVLLLLCVLIVISFLKRRWWVLFGFGLTLLISSAIVFFYRPTFILECLQSSAGSNLFLWETPTLPTAAAKFFGISWLRFAGLFLIPFSLLVWWRYRNDVTLLEVVNLAILGSLYIAPFAWSYDFAILLLPMIQIVLWLSLPGTRRVNIVVVALIAFVVYIIYYYQRFETPSEFYFYWVPLLVGSVYLTIWITFRNRSTKKLLLDTDVGNANFRL